MGVRDYDTTPNNNSTINGINIAENCAPAGINDALRNIMADVREFYDETTSSPGYTAAEWIAGTAAQVLPAVVITSGYTSAGDGGAGIWVQVVSEPSHDAKRQFTDGVNTEWYELTVTRVRPEMLGPFGTDAEQTAALNSALQYSARNGVSGRSDGDYNITGTIAPGGPYTWDWGQTRLLWAGSDITTLTQLLFNPLGSTTPQPSGKYVLFDTKDCESAVNGGSLVIRGASLGNFNTTSRALVEENLVAISASDNNSPGMIWDNLELLGCGHGLWQGDQRGDDPNILPYTRWSVRRLEIRFCLVAIEGGFAGNCFDDGHWGNIRLTRNADNGVIRTDFICSTLFLNGLLFDAANPDKEAQTVNTSAGNAVVTLSADNSAIQVGTILAIQGANNNLNSSATIGHVSRVSAKSGLSVTLETAPDRTVSGAAIIVDPPKFALLAADLRADHIYAEECHDTPIILRDNSFVYSSSLKASNGSIDCRYNTPYLIADYTGVQITGILHRVSGATNTKMKGLIGAPISLVASPLQYPQFGIDVQARDRKSNFVSSSVIRGILPETDHFNDAVVEGLPGTAEQTLKVDYTGTGTQYYHVYKAGPASELILEDGRGYNLGDSLTGDDMSTMTRTGNFTVTSGIATKAAGGQGTIYFAPSGMAPLDEYMIEFVCDTFTVSGVVIELFDSSGSGTAAGDRLLVDPVNIRSIGTDKVKLTIPAGSPADRIGLFGNSASAQVFSRFRIRKLT